MNETAVFANDNGEVIGVFEVSEPISSKGIPTAQGLYVAWKPETQRPFIAGVYESCGEMVADSGCQECPIPLRNKFFDGWPWFGPLPELLNGLLRNKKLSWE